MNNTSHRFQISSMAKRMDTFNENKTDQGQNSVAKQYDQMLIRVKKMNVDCSRLAEH